MHTYPLKCKAINKARFAYNYVYNATVYADNYANQENAHANRWWVDVETDNSWANSKVVNKASILGTVQALESKVPFAVVGVYNYPG
jgi:hypothetical protein